MSHAPALIIHGHFYQPPRENPWTGIVDREPSAAPFHDWNERIAAESYRPNGWARIFGDDGRVREIVNNYEAISFNYGPTLLAWLERRQPEAYQRILAADRASVAARGHGNAIAQGYNHAILPLMTDRDLVTQVRWGLAEFRHRFRREAASLWLPETACDDRTLGVLIDHEVRYAILAPGQASRLKTAGGWVDVSNGSIDPRRPYRYFHRDGSGRSIALFFYDGAVSRGVAFEGALSSSRVLVDRIEAASGGLGTLVHAATDGESYGHHHKFGDRCLAHALFHEAPRRGFWVTNYAELLDHHPAELEVEIKKGEDGKGTSWSCAHGVGRWHRDCGCHTGGKPGWNQRWRTPLREALDVLRDRAAAVFEERMGALVRDPWATRDAYVQLVLDRSADRKRFFEVESGRRLGEAEQLTALHLLESQRSSMVMYTSCGWFFNDLSGIETLQVLRYAGRLLDQLRELGVERPETGFFERLGEAKSNIAEKGTGVDLFEAEVTPRRVTSATVAAHVSMERLVSALPAAGEVASRRFEVSEDARTDRGRWSLATARIPLEEIATGAATDHASCAIHLGGVELHAVLRAYTSEVELSRSAERIHEAFGRDSLLTVLRIAEEELGPDDYGLESILDEQRPALSRAVFEGQRERYAALYEAMYQEARITVGQFIDAGLPLPLELRTAVELALAYRFDELIERAPADGFARSDYAEMIAIADEAARFGCALRKDEARRHLEDKLALLARRVCASRSDGSEAAVSPAKAALELLDVAERLDLHLETERPQELLFSVLSEAPSEAVLTLARALGLHA